MIFEDIADCITGTEKISIEFFLTTLRNKGSFRYTFYCKSIKNNMSKPMHGWKHITLSNLSSKQKWYGSNGLWRVNNVGVNGFSLSEQIAFLN